MLKRINETITKEECNNISVKAAKKHQKLLEKQREKYKKELCKQIRSVAKRGGLSTSTFSLYDRDFIDYKFFIELKEYFEERGFKVEEVRSRHGLMDTWLRISWE